MHQHFLLYIPTNSAEMSLYPFVVFSVPFSLSNCRLYLLFANDCQRTNCKWCSNKARACNCNCCASSHGSRLGMWREVGVGKGEWVGFLSYRVGINVFFLLVCLSHPHTHSHTHRHAFKSSLWHFVNRLTKRIARKVGRAGIGHLLATSRYRNTQA